MAGFRRTRAGIEVKLRAGERGVLRQLIGEVVELIGPGSAVASADAPADPLDAMVSIPDTAPAAPTDPVLARLLPDGYRQDPEAAAEFRRYTEGELRAVKSESAARVLADLGGDGPRLLLDEPGAEIWLSVLNDVRLALGTRLSVTEDTYDELNRLRSHDPRARALAVYAWLGYLQETLVTAVAR